MSEYFGDSPSPWTGSVFDKHLYMGTKKCCV